MKTKIRQITIIIALLVAGFVLSKQWDTLKQTFQQLRLNWLLASLMALIVYQIMNAWVWGLILRKTGSSISSLNGARMWIETECGKWIPGGIWGYGSRVIAANEFGVSTPAASKGLMIELLTTFSAWCITACFIFTDAFAFKFIETLEFKTKYWLIIAGVVLSVALIGALIVWKYKDKLKKQIQSLYSMRSAFIVAGPSALINYTILCLWNGCALYFMIKAFTPADVPLLQVIGIGGFAWICGFLAIGVPGGIGVRESILVMLLSHLIPAPQAVLLAIFWRASQILVEMFILMVSIVIGKWMRSVTVT